MSKLTVFFFSTGVDRPHPRDITGPAGATGRETAGLRFGGGLTTAQLRRRDQVGPSATDGQGPPDCGDGHVLRDGSARRVRQDVVGQQQRVGRQRLVAADRQVGAGHPEEHTRHTQATDEHGGRRCGRRTTTATAERFRDPPKRPNRPDRSPKVDGRSDRDLQRAADNRLERDIAPLSLSAYVHSLQRHAGDRNAPLRDIELSAPLRKRFLSQD